MLHCYLGCGLVKEAVLLDMVLHKSQFMGNDMAGCMTW
jgi:hypothetical protein